MPEWVLGQNFITTIKENFKAQKNVPNGFLIDCPTQNIGPKNKVEDKRSNVKWRAPPKGWIKGSFDGAARVTPKKLGVEEL